MPKYTPSNWLTFKEDFNYNRFIRDVTFDNMVFDFSADQWNSELMTKLILPVEIDFEATGGFQSSFHTLQSEISENIFLDLVIVLVLVLERDRPWSFLEPEEDEF